MECTQVSRMQVQRHTSCYMQTRQGTQRMEAWSKPNEGEGKFGSPTCSRGDNADMRLPNPVEHLHSDDHVLFIERLFHPTPKPLTHFPSFHVSFCYPSKPNLVAIASYSASGFLVGQRSPPSATKLTDARTPSPDSQS